MNFKLKLLINVFYDIFDELDYLVGFDDAFEGILGFCGINEID